MVRATLREGSAPIGQPTVPEDAVIYEQIRAAAAVTVERPTTRRSGTSHGATRKEAPAVWVNSPAGDNTHGVLMVSVVTLWCT